jgi:hypothetical protein
MAALNAIFPGGFDAAAVEPDAGRSNEPVPPGVYEAEVTNAEVKDAKSGNGSYLSLEFTILGPTHARRKVWQNITLTNRNDQAQQIGQAQLSALCRAAGIPVLTDSDQLFQRLVRIRVGIEPAKDGYEAKSRVDAYEAMGTPAPAGSAARPAANAPAPAVAGAKKAPWAR